MSMPMAPPSHFNLYFSRLLAADGKRVSAQPQLDRIPERRDAVIKPWCPASAPFQKLRLSAPALLDMSTIASIPFSFIQRHMYPPVL
jgi:hypothetical protein